MNLGEVCLGGIRGDLQCYVKELDGAVARGCDELIFVNFRPGTVVQPILCVESESAQATKPVRLTE